VRRGLAVAIAFVAVVGVGALLYIRLRIPPQGEGEHWRVLGTSASGLDGYSFVPTVSDSTATLLPGGPQLEPDEVGLAVMIDSGDNDYVRVTDVEFIAPVVQIEVRRHEGFSSGDDAISTLDVYVLAVSRERMAGMTMVQVDDRPALPLNA
jgi:hypothetical protein